MHKPEGIGLLQEEEVLPEKHCKPTFALIESLAQFEENQARFNADKQARSFSLKILCGRILV